MRPLLILAAVVVAAGCGGSDEQSVAPAPSASIQELASLDPIVQRFEADRGKPRLLLIFSPT